MKEAPRSEGMQDPRLEVSRNWHEKVTPTTDKDIRRPAKVYVLLVESAITHTMALEGCGDETNPFYAQQQEALATVRDEVRAFGFKPDLFNDVVAMKIRKLKKDEAEEMEGDQQSVLGDVPANINWGNHAFKKDK